jgi:D-alanine-D-alanine ligase
LPVDICLSNIPVLLLFNMDPGWTVREQEEALGVTSQLDEAMTSLGYQLKPVAVTDSDLDSLLARYNPLDFVVLNWCESIPGVNHSEWMVADYLERRGFAFTGAGPTAIALSQDKPGIKTLLDTSGIKTPRWQVYSRESKADWDRFPAIVKPSREHCSEGIDRNAVVTNKAELEKRVDYVFRRFRQPALVEDFIDGRELHVSLWENGSIDMLPPAEMEFSFFQDEHDRICSYEAKFVPAPLNDWELRELERICKRAYMVSGCRDYARIDVRMKDGELYILDVNPNADISPDTTTIGAVEYAGYTYGEFGGRIVSLAARRHPVWGREID